MKNLYQQPTAQLMSNLKKMLTVPQYPVNDPMYKNTPVLKPGAVQAKLPNQGKKSEKEAIPEKKASDQKKASDLTLQMRGVTIPSVLMPKTDPEEVSQERLQEAVIWSEILGKPLSKRRKRRM